MYMYIYSAVNYPLVPPPQVQGPLRCPLWLLAPFCRSCSDARRQVGVSLFAAARRPRAGEGRAPEVDRLNPIGPPPTPLAPPTHQQPTRPMSKPGDGNVTDRESNPRPLGAGLGTVPLI